jgi:hypothetical protein
MSEPKFIYADFMKCDNEGRLVLTCLGTHNDLAKHKITLENGLTLLFYNDDADDFGNEDNLVVSGIVQYDESHKRWVAVIDWDKIKNISNLSAEERVELGLI